MPRGGCSTSLGPQLSQFTWAKKSDKGKHYVFCLLCKKDINIKSSITGRCRDHEKTSDHTDRDVAKDQKQSTLPQTQTSLLTKLKTAGDRVRQKRLAEAMHCAYLAKERFDEGRLLEKMEAAAGIYTKQKKETKERKRNAEEDAKKRGS